MIKLKDNGSKIEVWKISHGRNRDMSQNDHELLLENNLVSIGHGDDQRQGEYFRKIPKGAYFYLVRNAHIVLWGQFDSDVTSEPPEGFAKINWVARKIKIIKLKSPGIPSSEIEVDFRTRLWGPSGRSTVFQVPSNQLEKFEKDILKPVFGLSLLNESESPEGDITEGIESMTNSLNSILYGPPGTGKTYNTVIKALKIIKLGAEVD